MTSGQLKLYGRPSSAAAALRAAVHQLLLEHDGDGDLPTSNRFLFYELVQRGILDKTKTRQTGRGADQNLSDASKWLRDEGLVPWGWIVDETRSLTEWDPRSVDGLGEVRRLSEHLRRLLGKPAAAADRV